MTADLVIVVPMLHRAHRVVPLLDSIREATPGARVLFVTSPNDDKVTDAVDAEGVERIEVDGPHRGDYARKINAGYRHTTEPLLFCGADDLHFHPGWLNAATAKLRPGIGVVGTNDLCNPRVMRGHHATHSLVTRSYADEFGTIDSPGQVLHEGYWHEMVDDELVATAKHRRAWAFAGRARVEHLHPMAGRAPMDELYSQQAVRIRSGRVVFNERCHLWG